MSWLDIFFFGWMSEQARADRLQAERERREEEQRMREENNYAETYPEDPDDDWQN